MSETALVRVAVAVAVCLGGFVAMAAAQSQPVTRNARPENVVQGVRRWYEVHQAEWRKRAAPCLHYLDEAETFHNKGKASFVAASRAGSSSEQSRLMRLGNDAIAERDRLINEFYACTRRMTAGDVFASQNPPRNETPPPDDPGEPPTGPPRDPVPPPGREPPDRPRPPEEAGPLPPGFPFPPAEARSPKRSPTNRPSAPSQSSKSKSTVPVIIALGDSITAGEGLDREQAYPAVLQGLLKKKGFNYRVVNAGVTDDTAAGVRDRLGNVLDNNPNTKILILEIGLNDLPRNLNDLHSKRVSITDTKKAIAEIITEAKRRGISVLLCGMQPPPPFQDAISEFTEMYPKLASAYHVKLLPKMLENVWKGRWTLADGVHPNVYGANLLAIQVQRALAGRDGGASMIGPPGPQGSGKASPTLR